MQPLDTTLIDPHLGTIDDFRETIQDIHSRGMYIMLDITISTYSIRFWVRIDSSLGDLIGFRDYMNSSTPFSLKEHRAAWKTDRRYLDFDFNNVYNSTCKYPRFWGDNGLPVVLDTKGCYDRSLQNLVL